MDDDPKTHDAPLARRDFFRSVLLLGFDALEQTARAVRIIGEGGGGSASDGAPARFLRPPGALDGPAFAERCSLCGDCVRACPAQCIVIDPHAAGGLPHIVARESPCVVCDDLSCMKACPTGALSLVTERGRIDMGLAAVDHDRCLRSSGVDEAQRRCTACVDDCPFGPSAITVDANGRIGVLPGCVGCGVCERVCPTEPASIWVVPHTTGQHADASGDAG